MRLSSAIEALLMASSDALASQALLDLLLQRKEQVSEELEETKGEGEREALVQEEAMLKEVSLSAVTAEIASLNRYYLETERSFQIIDTAFGWKIYTTPLYSGLLEHLYPIPKAQKLSQPAMETLAIIAYRQPITKASIEAVRGVSSDGTVQKLLNADLVSISGRSDLPGRPLLYTTTDFFLEHFGVKDITDLPNSQELRNMAWPKTRAEDAGGELRQMGLGEFSERQIEENKRSSEQHD